MQKISVAIITFNEEKNIERCLSSVQTIADEIVVVDSFSTDTTKSICEKFEIRFIENPFGGHIEQKNFAKDQCTYDLVLSLDADEVLSPELIESITKIKEVGTTDGYYFNRLNHYCGVPVHHCGWYPDKSLRLWNRTKGEWGGNNPHDKFFMNSGCKTEFLPGDLLHFTFHSIEQHVEQINKFSTISAQSKFKKGKKSSLFKIVVYPSWRFIRNYIFKGGYRDGFIGFVICKNSAHAVFLKYCKLYYMQSQNKSNN